MRGRKPLPSKIILLKGGTKHTHRPLRKNEPKPPATIPKCPEHLDKEAQAEWKRMAKEFKSLGILTQLDKAIFAVYCETFSTWAKATKMIQEKGMVFSTPGKTKTHKDGSVETMGGGFPIQNPYFPIANKAKEQMMKALIEMGMTPSSRARVKITSPPKEEDDKERFFD